MTVDIAQFHRAFFEESFEHLAHMEAALLQLDRDDDPELINVIFRGAHSIKGGSATFGFAQIAEFTHLAETLLERIRSGRCGIDTAIVALLLESVDVLRAMIAALKDGAVADRRRIEDVQRRLQQALVADETPSRTEAAVADAALRGATAGWRILFRPHRHLFQTGNDPYRLLRELQAMGPIEVRADTAAVPAFAELAPEECYVGWDIRLHADVQRKEIDEIFAWVEGDCELAVEPLAARREIAAADGKNPVQDPPPAVENGVGKERRAGEGESIRVSIDKIDALINMVGELVITQSMLSQMGEGMHEFSHAKLEKLRDGLAQLERNSREMQESVMRIRMLPISFAFSRFPRLVHDLCQKLGKKVELKLSGEQTELDKTVMEKIGDPLVHLVRNALDHGIEPPEVRRACGKSETGQVHLNAYHQGGNIVIEIGDDGAGLDRARIEAKARQRGLLQDDAVLSDERLIDLIFEPGFSTAESVSDVSGRGVGMDVVRRNIRDLGGSVEATSEEGKGSRFTIRLPLTLAILDGQSVRVGEQIYIMPLVSIIESLQVRPERVNVVAGRGEVYRLRDEYIPVMRLNEMFAGERRAASLAGGLLVVVERDGRKLGLVVDDLLGQQQVVIKSLESNFKPVPGISGATILGDGTVALIVDAGGLAQRVRDTPIHEQAGSVIAAA